MRQPANAESRARQLFSELGATVPAPMTGDRIGLVEQERMRGHRHHQHAARRQRLKQVGERSLVVVEMLGRVQPGEVVSVKYLGDKESGATTYSNFGVSRKAPAVDAVGAPGEPVAGETPEEASTDGFPF